MHMEVANLVPSAQHSDTHLIDLGLLSTGTISLQLSQRKGTMVAMAITRGLRLAGREPAEWGSMPTKGCP